MAPLLRAESCPQVLAALRAASETSGFAYLKNHGVPMSVIDNARVSARAFFGLSEQEKSSVSISPHHRGWLASGGARMADDVAADLKESFIWGAQSSVEEGSLDHPLRGSNRWPDQHVPDLRHHADSWFEHASVLARTILRALALGLGTDADTFLKQSDRPLSRASFVYYPQQPETPAPGQFGVGPHTDFGVLTILCQDDVGGLEVQHPDGQWRRAPPVPGTLLINVGDLLQRWTNGLFRSVPHRVKSPPDSDRLSLVLAYDPNPETIVDARTLFPNDECQETISCGDYLDWRFARAFAYRQTKPE